MPPLTQRSSETLRFCVRSSAVAVKNLAQIAREQSVWLLHYSTDYVFDGSKQSPYSETDTPNPINVYGASKRWRNSYCCG